MKLRKQQKQPASRRWRKRVTGSLTKLTRSQEASTSEANATASTTDEGVLRMEGAAPRLPAALIEAGDNSEPGIKPGPFVLLITALALAFIIIITWFIAQMPEK